MSWHYGTTSSYQTMIDKIVAFCTQNVVATYAVNAGGTGYVVGDVLTISGGTATVAAKFRVTAVSGGVVTAVKVNNAGAYTANPSSPASTTGGTGTGCTLTITMTSGNGWTAMRDDSSGGQREVILRGNGSGSDQIFVGIKSYNVSDSYNWEVAGFTGYNSGVAWDLQPDISPGRAALSEKGSFVPLGNTTFDYWVSVTPYRIMGVCKVGSAYPNFHMGFLKPFATTSEHPYPLWICGCTDEYDLKFNDTSINYSGLTDPINDSPTYPNGGVSFMRMPDGSWVNFVNSYESGSPSFRTKYQQSVVQPAGQQFGLESSGQGIIPYAADKWYTDWPWTYLIPNTGHPGVETFHLRPTPNDSGKRLLFPAQLVTTYPTRAFVGQVDGLYWFHAAGTVTAEQTIEVGSDIYRIFQNCNRSDDFTFFCIKEA
jgi:hypothetical protein